MQPPEVTAHKGNLLNDAIKIEAFGEPGPGGAYQGYRMTAGDPAFVVDIPFQQGNPADKINGFSNEALLAIVHHRMTGFVNGPFGNSPHNHVAMSYVAAALNSLKERTAERTARGVEGQQIA